MSDFGLSAASLKKLEGVHPDLQALTKRAIELTRIDFGVSEGVRTYDRQCQLVKEGASNTLHSKHLLQIEASGSGHAIDIFAFLNNKVTWANKYYGPVLQAFMTAAIELETQVVFGHLWQDFQDSVHIELNEKYYG